MKEFLAKMFDFSGMMESDFGLGYFIATMIVLGLLLILLVVRVTIAIIVHRNMDNGIKISNGDGGWIIISQKAITSAMKSLEKEFNCIEVSKVFLNCSKRKNTLTVRYVFNCNGSNSLQEQNKELKSRIEDLLTRQLGVDNISEILLEVSDIKMKSSGAPKHYANNDDAVDNVI